MANEINTPDHRYYQPRNNIKLNKSDMSKGIIFASGITKIDAWINSQPWGNPVTILARDETAVLDRFNAIIERRAV